MMWQHAYVAQCDAHDASAPTRARQPRAALTLLALAMGSFCIGTSEFASMGIIQLFSQDLGVDVAGATNAIAGYALGVVLGAPLITLAAARVNRRTLLLGLMCLFVVGNLLSTQCNGIGTLTAARLISGLPQGAYFGAAAVVATHVVGRNRGGRAFATVMVGLTLATVVGSPFATVMGQHLGWRQTYLAVSLFGVVALACLWSWVPKTNDLAGGSLAVELGALRNRRVWLVMSVAALGVSSIFAIYTFIGPLTTETAHLPGGFVPISLALFGVGMTAGNIVGGRLADRHPSAGIIGGFSLVLGVLVTIALWGSNGVVLLTSLSLVGAFMLCAVPTIQVELTTSAPEAPTLMGAMNIAALNVGNTLGAWGGGAVVSAGLGLLATAWAGFTLTASGLLLYVILVRPSIARRERSRSA